MNGQIFIIKQMNAASPNLNTERNRFYGNKKARPSVTAYRLDGQARNSCTFLINACSIQRRYGAFRGGTKA